MRESLIEEHSKVVENQRKMLYFSLIFGAMEAINIKKFMRLQRDLPSLQKSR